MTSMFWIISILGIVVLVWHRWFPGVRPHLPSSKEGGSSVETESDTTTTQPPRKPLFSGIKLDKKWIITILVIAGGVAVYLMYSEQIFERIGSAVQTVDVEQVEERAKELAETDEGMKGIDGYINKLAEAAEKYYAEVQIGIIVIGIILLVWLREYSIFSALVVCFLAYIMPYCFHVWQSSFQEVEMSMGWWFIWFGITYMCSFGGASIAGPVCSGSLYLLYWIITIL